MQGVIGWLMVKSGLEEKQDPHAMPRVSQYRSAAHLGAAFMLYSLFLYQGLSHVLLPNQLANVIQISRLRKYAHGVMTLIFITSLSGAFVAGLDAGLVYNTWPKMADRWVPTDILTMSPKWKNFFENATTVQFNHRHLAEFTGVSILGLWWLCRKSPLPHRTRLIANAVGAMALVQVGLGIGTLLMYVPVWLATTHQAGALSLLTLSVWLTHELRRMPK
jgi:cytochrome c oxidase assembly protein subunit 15